MANIKDIEGIGPAYAEKLKPAGITTVSALLTKGAGPQDRRNLEAATGISHELLLRWINHADLMRVKGIGPEYAELLEAAGVDSLPELAQRNAENLHPAMMACNGEKKLVRRPPSLKQVKSWIKQANHLPRAITY
ncbi:MAG TPA: DUF4332 domain-containing protein [bacterium]|nr:DUF4332 domain-containing protein [bacterium]